MYVHSTCTFYLISSRVTSLRKQLLLVSFLCDSQLEFVSGIPAIASWMSEIHWYFPPQAQGEPNNVQEDFLKITRRTHMYLHMYHVYLCVSPFNIQINMSRVYRK